MEDMKSFKHLAVALFLLMVGTGLAAAQQGGSVITDNAADRYRIGFQDVIDIQVYRHPDLNIRQTVSPDGFIRVARLNQRIAAVCKTETELANDIMAAYKVGYLVDPFVTVTVAEQKSQPISVIGAVEKPGSYFVTKHMHLLEILALAGGPNKEAGTRMLVARPGNTTTCRDKAPVSKDDDDIALMNFKIREVQEGKRTLIMEPGDIVSVLPADNVFVYGNVVEPGQILVREPITLTQAIASSKGLKSAADKDAVRILRQRPDSLERDEIVVDLKAIEKGNAKDPYLEANDIVAVSRDDAKAVLNGIVRTIQNGVPAILTRRF